MNVKDVVRTRAEPQSTYERRARYHTSENPFTFGYPPVPARQFLAERDRAFDPATPTSAGSATRSSRVNMSPAETAARGEIRGEAAEPMPAGVVLARHGGKPRGGMRPGSCQQRRTSRVSGG